VHYIEGGSIWDVPCEVAMPSATQNELTGKDADGGQAGKFTRALS
jgi:glutamate dehydrogenase (NADP+)